MSGEFQNRWTKSLDQAVPEQHPAPDMLNAYVERILQPTEEQQVVAHLSVCAECREIVYLASGAAEEESLPVVTSASARRVRWWTWAVPLLALLVVASTVFLVRSDHGSPTASPEIAQARRDGPAADVAPASAGQSSDESARVAAPRPAPSNLAKDALSKRKGERSGIGSAPEQEDQRVAAANAPVPQVAYKKAERGAVTESAEPASAPAPAPPSVAVETTQVDVNGQNALVESEPAQSLNKTEMAAKKAPVAGYSMGRTDAEKMAADAQWRVTRDGKLEHLLRGEWKTAVEVPRAQFLTVHSVGKEVWAAGRNLALYHSSDNGVHWKRQTVPTSDSDIVRIDFSSTRDGVLQTNSAESFTTHDGGEHWAPLLRNDTPTP